ncbi:MAG: hypothetical protein IJG53_09135 [Eggerthellaceae bacterium]|nr:hypothetical protein [Eggerthellaceae bacterium]
MGVMNDWPYSEAYGDDFVGCPESDYEDAYTWLMANRCPLCMRQADPHECLKEEPMVLDRRKGGDGWRCYGYRAKAWRDGR